MIKLMKTVLKLLIKELKGWKDEVVVCKKFHEGCKRFPKNYVKCVKRANLHIQELEKAIKIINESN